jgi:hypothetical protein
MSATWILGDLHGCADELAALLDRLKPGPDDRVLSVGDLWHRGPDPVGVTELMRQHRIRFILGNHERRLLDRFGLAPQRSDASDRPPLESRFGSLEPEDMAGDGNRPLHAPPERFGELLEFLQGHLGYYVEHTDLEGAGPTRDGRPWCAVHAGVIPGLHPAEAEPENLCSLRRLRLSGRPFWYEVYTGPNLILFGHSPSETPRLHHHGGQLVAAGLDTGCVYGGSLTAYSPELDAWESVACLRAGGYCER